MKTKILALLIIAGGLFGLTSCHKALDLSPKDRITDLELWNNQQLVILHTNYFYSQLRSGFSNSLTSGQWLFSSLTDDAVAPSATSSARTKWGTNFTTSSNSPANTLWTSSSNSRWVNIRRANLYLANIDNVPGDQALNKRLKAEVRFLRAYYYYDLVSFFGAVPIITAAQESTDSLFLPRNPLPECYNFIMTELDLAANDLPSTYPASDLGRVTKQAAWGLKCRVQMMKEDWAGAAATAKAIMDLGANSLVSSYATVFTNKAATNTEILLAVQHNNSKDELGTQFDLYTLPPYFGGQGNNCPTQNLVDEYEMRTTGKPITDPTSGYDETKPYLNRDPRFDATILYDGVTFKGRTMEMFTGGADITVGGVITANNASPTGYYLRKFTSESINPADQNVRSSNNWPLIRYAEILLNYAESQNEAIGPDASVYAAVNAVRQRAGMPQVASGLTQNQMRNVIRHERRIELAFEDHRYWDVKRWKQAVNLFTTTSTPIRKATITRNATTGAKTYDFTKTITYNRTFLERNYLFPIPKTEIDKPGNKLTQSPGWE